MINLRFSDESGRSKLEAASIADRSRLELTMNHYGIRTNRDLLAESLLRLDELGLGDDALLPDRRLRVLMQMLTHYRNERPRFPHQMLPHGN